ncbi:hypothetical protein [Flammeovirga sp. OC4]|uniref:hypothetical protein n=1 Tax=Flammeovirga sp. OC4 TaxID=1382345 RepID=UPI0005C6158E|nr:hypothetical protein [Flammeovirga sp. OC4]
MKFPETPIDFKNEIKISVDKYDSIGDLRIRQFIKFLPKVPHEVIVEGIILLIEDEKSGFQEQEVACKILAEIKPKSTLDLNKIVRRIIGTWNKSCKEIIFWLVQNYGIDQVKTCFDNLENDLKREHEIDKLKTMKWWLRIKEKNKREK